MANVQLGNRSYLLSATLGSRRGRLLRRRLPAPGNERRPDPHPRHSGRRLIVGVGQERQGAARHGRHDRSAVARLHPAAQPRGALVVCRGGEQVLLRAHQGWHALRVGRSQRWTGGRRDRVDGPAADTRADRRLRLGGRPGGGAARRRTKTDGTLYSWGGNSYGQLGAGDTNNRASPRQEGNGGTAWTAIAAGGYHTVALTAQGYPYAWGQNDFGQLGLGSTDATSLPAYIPWPTGFPSPGEWYRFSGGYDFSFGLANNGTIWSWGHNQYGQLAASSSTTVAQSNEVHQHLALGDDCGGHETRHGRSPERDALDVGQQQQRPTRHRRRARNFVQAGHSGIVEVDAVGFGVWPTKRVDRCEGGRHGVGLGRQLRGTARDGRHDVGTGPHPAQIHATTSERGNHEHEPRRHPQLFRRRVDDHGERERGGQITKVDFYVGNTRKWTDTTSPYSFNWSTVGVSPSKSTLTAVATNALGESASSRLARRRPVQRLRDIRVDRVRNDPQLLKQGRD